MADAVSTAPATPAPAPSDAEARAPSKRVGVWTMLLAVLIVGILAIYAVAYTVPAGCVAVVKTFGRPNAADAASLPGPGLQWKAPAPIQTVQIVDLRERLLPIRDVELQMDKLFNIFVVTSVNWRVVDPIKFITAHPTVASMEQALRVCVEDARSMAVTAAKLDDLVSTSDKQPEKYAAFEEAFLTAARANLDPAFGVEVVSLSVSQLALAKDVTAAVQENMAAQRRAIARKFEQEGESEAQRVKDKAQAEADRELGQARADAIKIMSEGDAKAAAFLDVYKSPVAQRLALQLKQLEALEAAVTHRTYLVVSDTMMPFRLLTDTMMPGAAEPATR